MLKKMTLVLMTIGMAALAACNTVQGVGQDIESVGRKGEEVIN
jgi:entericidin B